MHVRIAACLAGIVIAQSAQAAEVTPIRDLSPAVYRALTTAGYAILRDPRPDATVFVFVCARTTACPVPHLNSLEIPGPYQFLSEPNAAGNDHPARRRRA